MNVSLRVNSDCASVPSEKRNCAFDGGIRQIRSSISSENIRRTIRRVENSRCMREKSLEFDRATRWLRFSSVIRSKKFGSLRCPPLSLSLYGINLRFY